jgi:hypothetical protein
LAPAQIPVFVFEGKAGWIAPQARRYNNGRVGEEAALRGLSALPGQGSRRSKIGSGLGEKLKTEIRAGL